MSCIDACKRWCPYHIPSFSKHLSYSCADTLALLVLTIMLLLPWNFFMYVKITLLLVSILLLSLLWPRCALDFWMFSVIYNRQVISHAIVNDAGYLLKKDVCLSCVYVAISLLIMSIFYVRLLKRNFSFFFWEREEKKVFLECLVCMLPWD